MVSRQEVVRVLKEYVGTPWLLTGRIKGKGIDCAGLMFAVTKEIGLPIEPHSRTCEYTRKPAGEFVLRVMRTQAKEVRVPLDGDILIFWMDEHSKRAQHIGFKAGDQLIHANANVGRVVSEPIAAWMPQFISAFQIRGVL